MGWEQRNGRMYYYQKERHGDRVVSRYIGAGKTAELIAVLESCRREEAADARADEIAEIEQLQREDAEADELFDAIKATTKAALLAAGCHQHKGEWRHRMQKKLTVAKPEPATRRELEELAERTNIAKPRPSDVAELRSAIAAAPDHSIWKEFGDLLSQARAGLLASTQISELARQTVRHRCKQMESELACSGDGALERLLIGQVVFAWLRLSLIEANYNQNTNNLTLKQAAFWEDRLTATHRRFQNACVALARVRKLSHPDRKFSVRTVNALMLNCEPE